MPIESIHCHILGAHISRITGLGGEIVRIVCVEYDEPTRDCRLKRAGRQGGPLSQLLERASHEVLDTKSVRCHLCP